MPSAARGCNVGLTAVTAWHSRQVLSWEVSMTLDEDCCVSALRRHGRPEIFNSDRGTELTGIDKGSLSA